MQLTPSAILGLYQAACERCGVHITIVRQLRRGRLSYYDLGQGNPISADLKESRVWTNVS